MSPPTSGQTGTGLWDRDGLKLKEVFFYKGVLYGEFEPALNVFWFTFGDTLLATKCNLLFNFDIPVLFGGKPDDLPTAADTTETQVVDVMLAAVPIEKEHVCSPGRSSEAKRAEYQSGRKAPQATETTKLGDPTPEIPQQHTVEGETDANASKKENGEEFTDSGAEDCRGASNLSCQPILPKKLW